ncbi:sirohydrochlorin chelatase [Coralliovum pocilloporae]|uniref:sirohydrochlorin chelatase n=1 Tax=Coralliovum pocilloporae TaxID=3066369 RepID=UPI003307C507
MSGTRLHFPKAPATKVAAGLFRKHSEPETGLLIVAHGERGGKGNNDGLAQLTEAVSLALPELTVCSAVLNGEQSLEDVLSRMRNERILVYPYFLSDGYFVRTVLPRRLGLSQTRCSALKRRFKILKPFGLSDMLPDLITSLVRDAAGNRDLSALDVLIAAHGSTSGPRPKDCTEALAARLQALGTFPAVRCAYISEPPFLEPAIETLHRPTVVVPLFAGEGAHGIEDIAAALKALPEHSCVTGIVGNSVQAAQLIASSIQ